MSQLRKLLQHKLICLIYVFLVVSHARPNLRAGP